ncbi:unnamed protein product [Bathycoccus prasinos]|jgi:hypothetical protein
MATFTTLQREYRRTDGTVVSLPPGTIKLLEKKKSDVHVFLNKDRTKTKLVKLFLLVMLAWMVFAMQSHPDVKKTRGVISGPKAFSLFGGRKDLRHTSLEQRDMLRKQKAEERERRDVERYGATNPALRGSSELEMTGKRKDNRIDWKEKVNELGREYQENRRRAERENRWDGKAQKYGMLSSRGGGGDAS